MLTYRSASPSYWACFLLPTAIYLADIKFKGTSSIALSIMLCNTTLLIAFHVMGFKIQSLLKRLKNIYFVLSFLTIAYCYYNEGDCYEYSSYVTLNFTFPYLFYNLIRLNPKSFTFAEGIIVTSAFSYNFWLASQNLPFPPDSLQTIPEANVISIFVQLLFFAGILAARFFLLTVQPWKLFELEELYCLWAKCCLIAFSFRLPDTGNALWFLIAQWPFEILFGSNNRVAIFLSWAGCLACAAGFVYVKNSRGSQATSVDRKAFHFLIVAVYLVGVLKDFNLIYFCSTCVLFVFITVETVRVLRFEILGLKIGEFIDAQVQVYKDHQDEGNLILTPIYLLAGCSLPIWLTGLYKDSTVLEPLEIAAALAGVFSIGIGDTFSSIGGTLFGKTKWTGSNKTLEGTACSVVSQYILMLCLIVSGFLPYNFLSIVGLMTSIVINALAEAKTDQIDNLIVPLVSFNAVHIFKYVTD